MKSVKNLIDEITKKEEKSDVFSIEVAVLVEKSYKDYTALSKRIDGKQYYKVVNFIYYAKDIKKELDKTVKSVEISKAEHIDVDFDGNSEKGLHNVYTLFIDKLSKGNKGGCKKISEKFVQYSDEDLKGKRFVL